MDTSALIQECYQALCNALFTIWVRNVKRNQAYARKIRSLLSAVHSAYRDDQACPAWYAEYVLNVASKLHA